MRFREHLHVVETVVIVRALLSKWRILVVRDPGKCLYIKVDGVFRTLVCDGIKYHSQGPRRWLVLHRWPANDVRKRCGDVEAIHR